MTCHITLSNKCHKEFSYCLKPISDWLVTLIYCSLLNIVVRIGTMNFKLYIFSLPKANVRTTVRINSIFVLEHSHLLSRLDLRIRYSTSSSLRSNLSFIMPLKCYLFFANVVIAKFIIKKRKETLDSILLKKTSRITDFFISISYKFNDLEYILRIWYMITNCFLMTCQKCQFL